MTTIHEDLDQALMSACCAMAFALEHWQEFCLLVEKETECAQPGLCEIGMRKQIVMLMGLVDLDRMRQ